jgi:hypothetical protein
MMNLCKLECNQNYLVQMRLPKSEGSKKLLTLYREGMKSEDRSSVPAHHTK